MRHVLTACTKMGEDPTESLFDCSSPQWKMQNMFISQQISCSAAAFPVMGERCRYYIHFSGLHLSEKNMIVTFRIGFPHVFRQSLTMIGISRAVSWSCVEHLADLYYVLDISHIHCVLSLICSTCIRLLGLVVHLSRCSWTHSAFSECWVQLPSCDGRKWYLYAIGEPLFPFFCQLCITSPFSTCYFHSSFVCFCSLLIR